MKLTPEENEKLLPVFHCIFIWYFIQVDAHAYASLPALWQRSMHTRFSKSDFGGRRGVEKCFLKTLHRTVSFCVYLFLFQHTHDRINAQRKFFFFRFIFTIDWSRTGLEPYTYSIFFSCVDAISDSFVCDRSMSATVRFSESESIFVQKCDHQTFWMCQYQ